MSSKFNTLSCLKASSSPLLLDHATTVGLCFGGGDRRQLNGMLGNTDGGVVGHSLARVINVVQSTGQCNQQTKLFLYKLVLGIAFIHFIRSCPFEGNRSTETRASEIL